MFHLFYAPKFCCEVCGDFTNISSYPLKFHRHIYDRITSIMAALMMTNDMRDLGCSRYLQRTSITGSQQW